MHGTLVIFARLLLSHLESFGNGVNELRWNVEEVFSESFHQHR